ncbi:MAG: hypothetical protein KAR08_09255, partial [Candidatus Heimdallarchaeota archaeon]|nr:hypothetical protein [Candidatus Heimdallarchaeota archaeon]
MDKIPQENSEQEEKETKSPESALWIQFAGVGSAMYIVEQVGTVTSAQLLAIAGTLEFQANYAMSQEVMQKQVQVANPEQMNKILT